MAEEGDESIGTLGAGEIGFFRGDAQNEEEFHLAGGKHEGGGVGRIGGDGFRILAAVGGGGDEQVGEKAFFFCERATEGHAVVGMEQFALHLAGGDEQLHGHEPVQELDGPAGLLLGVHNKFVAEAGGAVRFYGVG